MPINEVSVADLEQALSTGGRLVDVREADEYEAGHVPGAQHVALGSVAQNLHAFAGEGPAYVICKSGGRSLRACEFLAGQGVEAINVAGGTMAWASSGRPVVEGSRPL